MQWIEDGERKKREALVIVHLWNVSNEPLPKIIFELASESLITSSFHSTNSCSGWTCTRHCLRGRRHATWIILLSQTTSCKRSGIGSAGWKAAVDAMKKFIILCEWKSDHRTAHLNEVRAFFIQHIFDWAPIKLPDNTCFTILFVKRMKCSAKRRHKPCRKSIRNLMMYRQHNSDERKRRKMKKQTKKVYKRNEKKNDAKRQWWWG